MEAATVKAGVGRRQGGRSAASAERRLAAWMMSPSLILMLLVAAYPIAYAVWLSLHQYSLIHPGLSRWSGIQNYKAAFNDPDFVSSFKNTFIFTFFSVTFELIIGVSMALLMHRAFRGQGLLRTVILVPWAMLTVVTAITWQTIFDAQLGFVNTLLGIHTVWLGQSPQAMIVLIIADVWKTSSFMALLVLAGLQVIPEEVYEAAKVDGATTWQRFWRITLPLLKPAILVALIFRTLDALRIFDLPFVLTHGQNNTNTLSFEAYLQLRANRLIGLGSAMSIITFITVMIVAMLYIRFVGGNIRGLSEET
jgi:multiple sugar transport system permease protein